VHNGNPEHILKRWAGKTILFPNIEPVYLTERDTIRINDQIKDYKILLYVDSTGCISCKLRLYLWNICIEELGVKSRFSFLFSS
jgi:hypothetical protein